MKKFLQRALLITGILLICNMSLFPVYHFYRTKSGYTDYSTEFNSYLLADSHGAALSDMLESYNIYNFSYASDSYFDMYRKIAFLSDKTNIKTIYIVADEHTLSPYREKANNADRSLFYASRTEFKNTYEYIKQKYIKSYMVLLQPKTRDIIRGYLYSRVKNIFLDNQTNEKTWEELDAHTRIKNAESRILGQFPSPDPSPVLKQTLLKIITLCREHNITLIGIKFPLSAEYITLLGNKNYGVEDIFRSNGIDILNYDNVFIDNQAYFADTDHLNEKGANEFIKLLWFDINK